MEANIYIYHWTYTEEYVVEIRGYGIMDEDTHVCVHIDGFLPHIYVSDISGVDLSHCARYSIVERENLYNFMPGVRVFYKIYFRTKSGMYKFIRDNRLDGVAHEQNASPILQFTTQRNLYQVGWIQIKNAIRLDDPGKCDVSFEVPWDSVFPSEGPFIQPLMCAFDLEVYSTISGAMPSDKPGDEIFQISAVFSDQSRFLLSLPGSDYDSDTVQLATEKELLEAFCKLMQHKRPMILIGYNILGFDIGYIIQRCKRLFILDTFLTSLGYGPKPADIKTLRWSSDSFGEQEFLFVDWEGLVTLDLYPLIKRDYKFSNYKLETVAQEILGYGKDPITFKDIMKAYETKEMKRVGEYCIKDSNLCLELTHKLAIWVALVQMANICHLQPAMLYLHGQQMKIHSQVYYYCHWHNIVVNTNFYKAPASLKYTGAFVMDPIPGLYQNVVPFDFSSLYPSIIITENICYSTIANNTTPDSECNLFTWEDHVGCEHDPKNIKFNHISEKISKLENEIKQLMRERDAARGQKKKEFQIKINLKRDQQRPLRHARADIKVQKKFIICAKHTFKFLKPSVKKGVIPTIIHNLLDARKKLRATMKSISDPFQKVIMDKQQLAYKISANSMYGAMGVRSGYLPYMPGAMVITHCGREAIKKSLKIIESKFNGKVIYGDTDSNYVQFLTIPTDRLWNYATMVAKEVSDYFPKTMNLEFEEKIYSQFILLGKKKYVFISESNNLGHKGVILSRRDNPKILRDVYLDCLNEIFSSKCLDNIIFLLIDKISQLGCISNKENFILTKSVGISDGEYDEETGYIGGYKVSKPLGAVGDDWVEGRLPPHVQLAKRMQRRGVPVQPGTRLEIIVLNKNDAKKLGEKFEDYDYYKERQWYLKIDFNYYLQNMINPLDQLLVTVFNQKVLEPLIDVIMKKQLCLQRIKDRRKPKLIFKP